MKKGWQSEAQREWGHSKEGIKQLGGKKEVAKWDALTKKKKLPKHK